MGDPRAHPASPGRPGPVLTTSHDDDQVQVDPSLAQHGLRQLRAPGSNLGQTTRRHGHGGRPRRPRPSQAVRLPAPPPHPATSLPSDTATHRHQRPDTGHLDAQTPAPDAGHLDRPRRTPDARTGHWTPDAGHERGHGERQHSRHPDPLGRHAERPHAETRTRVVPSHHQAAAWSPRRPGRASAHCCPRTITGRA